MATARERLRQLSIAQETANDEADRVSVQNRFGVPRGGGMLVRPVAPSAADVLDPERATPLMDFGEMFLNELGISTPRQRLARTETLAAIHTANLTIQQAVEDQARSIEARGVAGFDSEIFSNLRNQQLKAAELMDSPDASIREYGQAMMQSVAGGYDQLNKDHSARLATVRDGFTTRLNGLVDVGREEASMNDSVFAQVEEHVKRNGASAPLPVTIKESVAGYLGGSAFGQKEGETRGIFENLPGFNVAYDPSESITGGEASTLLASVSKARRQTILSSIARETETATRAGFRILDRDGRLDVDEIPVSELEPEISRLSGQLPPGQPFNIKPGLPTAEDARRTAQSSLDSAAASAGKYGAAADTAFRNSDFGRGLAAIDKAIERPLSDFRKFDRDFTRSVFQMMGLIPRDKEERPTND